MDSTVIGFWVILLGPPVIWWLRELRRKRGLAQREFLAQEERARRLDAQAVAGEGAKLLKQGQWAEALEAFDRAAACLQGDSEQGSPDQRAPGGASTELLDSLHVNSGRALERLGRKDEALREYEACQDSEGQLPQNAWPQLAGFHRGTLLVRAGDTAQGAAVLRRVLDGRPHLPRELQLDALFTLTGACRVAGDHAQALELARQGVTLAQRSGNALAEARMLRLAARSEMALDNFEDALLDLQRSLDLYRVRDNVTGEVEIKRDIARLYQATGDWLLAFSWLRACLEDEEVAEDRGAEARLCYDIACLSIDQGSLLEAGMFLQRSLALFRQAQDRQGIDEAGRTMMGLTVLIHRLATEDQLTYRDIERGSKLSRDKE
jgi:tetratricopeptide (TPR) repeat protein